VLRLVEVKLQTAWDRDYFYLSCQVPVPRDERRVRPMLSLFFDFRPPAKRIPQYRRGAYHMKLIPAIGGLEEDTLRERAKSGYFLAGTDDASAGRVVWKEFSWTGVARTDVAAAFRRERDRLVLEARFPWSTFPLPGGKTFRPKAGDVPAFAFDWGMSRGMGAVLMWSGSMRNLQDTSGFAPVVLLSRAEEAPPKKPGRERAVPRDAGRQEPARLSERFSGFSLGEAVSPTRYSKGSGLKIEIAADEPAGGRVSPCIFGQFSEHLMMGWPMVCGLWSQVLLNPSFEPGHPRLDSGYNERYLTGRSLELLERWSPGYKTADAVKRTAPPWTVVGDIGGAAMEVDAFNSRRCQKLSAPTGVGQVARLPIHRARDYDVAFYAKCSAPAVVGVSLRDTAGTVAASDVRVTGDEWRRFETTLRVPAELPDHLHRFFFVLAVKEGGPVWIDYATVFPSDNVEGLCPEVLEIFRELRPHHIRYPGGNFASGYHWRDGIGPPCKRPTRLNPAWVGLEPNEVGTDEFLRFCELAGLKAMLCVNFGSGTPEEAANWVEYCNGGPGTPMGRLRAQNGHPEPYNVMEWDIGNEVWGHWQIGHCPPDEYARRFLEFRKAMLARDPRIKIAACGHAPFHPMGRDWNRAVCDIAASGIDIMTFHTYVRPPSRRAGADPARRLRILLSQPHFCEQAIRDMADRMRSLGMTRPKIAVTEYNLQRGQSDSMRMERTTHLLWYAQMIHVWMRASDIVPLCDVTEYSPFDIYRRRFGGVSPRHEVFKLYERNAGDRPVGVRVTCPAYDVRNAGGGYPPLSDVPVADVVALTGEKGGRRFLSLAVVNKELKTSLRPRVRLKGFEPAGEATLLVLRDPEPWGGTDAMPALAVQETRVRVGKSFSYDIPACSVSLLVIRAADGRRDER